MFCIWRSQAEFNGGRTVASERRKLPVLLLNPFCTIPLRLNLKLVPVLALCLYSHDVLLNQDCEFSVQGHALVPAHFPSRLGFQQQRQSSHSHRMLNFLPEDQVLGRGGLACVLAVTVLRLLCPPRGNVGTCEAPVGAWHGVGMMSVGS